MISFNINIYSLINMCLVNRVNNKSKDVRHLTLNKLEN